MKSETIRNRSASDVAPLVLLLLALSAVFLFGNERDRFYRHEGGHDWVSSEHLAVAVNLSPAHNFLMFHSLVSPNEGEGGGVTDDGTRFSYRPYNRFPLGGYALISLTTLPFHDDLAARLHAARILMLVFFAGAAAAAWFAMSRLWSSRWIALTAVLLSFSSYYCLYYNDMVHPKTMMDLFGWLLTFHGIVVFLEENRFRQLLVKACAALLLGWHVLAMILTFVVLGIASEVVRTRPIRRGRGTAEPPAASLLRGKVRRYLTFGAAPLLLAAAILTFNFANEYAAFDGGMAWRDLPSVKSMQYRTGLNDEFNESNAAALAWRPFIQEEFRRIGELSVPFALAARAAPGGPSFFAFGIAISVVCLVCLTRVRPRLPLATLALSGFCWSLPMRHNTAFHDYECLFHIGIPLVVFAAAAAFTSRLSGRGLAGLCAAALLVFVLSSAEMSRVGFDAESADVHDALIADFEVIRRMTKGRTVYVTSPSRAAAATRFAGAAHALHYYLAGSVIEYDVPRTRNNPCRPGFVVTRRRVDGATLLTPENRLVFLYDRADYDQAGGFPLCGPRTAPRRAGPRLPTAG